PEAAAAATAAGSTGAAVTAARNETLNIGIGGRISDPTNFNLYAGGDRSGTGLHQVAYEYFFYRNLQTGEYIPWIAESYEYSDDFETITVQLREGVTWNDGEPFTTEDVVFTYDLLRENPGMTWAEEANKRVESVEAVDERTVRFNLTAPNPRVHENREAFPAVGIWGGISILPRHVWEGQDPLTFKNNPPVTTGPYTLANATETAITWQRNDNWWGTKVFNVTPPARVINFQYVGPETQTALALASNDIDTPFIGILSLGTFNEVAGRNPNIQAWQKEAPYAWLDPCPRALMIQNARPPWDKKEARWALSRMIDRQAIVNLAYEGTTVPAWGIWPLYDGLQPYFEAIQDLRDTHQVEAFDPARAEELFTTAGLTKSGDTWTTAEGAPLKVTYLVNADSNEEMKVSQVLADQLRTAGIEVELQPLSGGPLNDTILRGEYDIKLHSFCPGDIFNNLELFHSKFFVPLGENAPWYERNSFRYRNEALDAIIDQIEATPPAEVDQIKQLYHDAMAIWFEDLPVAPIVQAPALVPFNTTYWTGWPSAENPWNMPVSWWATFNLVLNGYPSPEDGTWVGGLKPAS
ncbi:MAG TPA: ABC transporter substrate-binding protein, partial [Herpetosiphonaceae bacterium]|nr:ABC transporter substrate-binding protein [Herpetosiphonaceae bacterium]